MIAPRTFLSYSHDSLEHEAAVLALAKQLRNDGCVVIIDQEHTWVSEGWTLWMNKQIQQADFVLMICTETYKRRAEGAEDPPKGAGATWEGAIIRLDLYEANGCNRKFIPVIMHKEDKAHRPFFLRDYSYFLATERDGYQKLKSFLITKEDTSEPSPAEPLWNIPPSDPYFFGRKEYIQNLRTALTKNNQPAALTQSIKGLGGLGKSKTALEYADLYRNEYTTGFWTVADSSDNLISGFAAFAGLLNLPQREEKDITKAAAAAKRWFESNSNWLLILDNVDDWEVAKDWIPTSKTGHVLITTQLQHTGNYAQGLELPRMTPDEGAKFLLERVKCHDPSAENLAAAKDISVEFDGLPLGLEQAGAYIDEADLSPAEYLELYQKQGKALRAKGDQGTVTRTFTLALEKLGERAKEIIRMAAFLAPDAIPEEILIAEGEPDIEFRDAVTNAIRYSLIWRNSATKTVSIHRLVQLVVKDTLEGEASKPWIERNAAAIARCFPEEVEFNNWAACERLLPHAKILAADILRLSIESKGAASLLDQTAWYLSDRGQYGNAELLSKRALEIREKVFGPDDLETAKSLNNLGAIDGFQGRQREAEPLLKRALLIRERALGPDHPNTAISLGNLASSYHAQGQYKEAEHLYQRAMQIYETAFGPNHPGTAMSLGNLAGNYGAQGQYKKAEHLYQRALQINKTALGPNHPSTASILGNLAGNYSAQGQYKQADTLYQRSLEIAETALGPNHPETASILGNLAENYREQGQYKAAEPLYQRVLQIRETALGTNHPETASSLGNLASNYRKQGQYKAAEPLYQRALQIRETALGTDHPDTASSLNGLAVNYHEQGQYKEAEPLYQRALQIRETALGPNHPDTATSLGNLAGNYHEQGQYKEAEPLHKRALQIRETALGPNHPDIAASLNNLALLYANRSNFLRSVPLFARALAILEKVHETNHPDTLQTAKNYHYALQSLGRGHEAAKLRKKFKFNP